jgi:hypothetical protein
VSRLFLAILLAAAVFLVSGCGGGDNSPPPLTEFQEAVVIARDRVDFALARIPKAKSLDEYTNRMEEASVVIEDAADDLDKLGPAEDFEDETKRLTSALHQLSVDYESSAEQIRLTPELIAGAAGLSFDSWDKANLALAAMAGKGIDVSVLQPHA